MSVKEVEYQNPGSHWWLVLIEGILAIILGILLIGNPTTGLVLIVSILGFYWLITGVITLISLFWNRTQWGWKLFTGIIGIIAGLVIIQNPITASLLVPATFALVLGILGIVFGISQLIQSFTGGGWGMAVLGVLSILLGFLLMVRPLVAGLTLGFMMGFLLILGGIVAIVASFGLRRESREFRESEERASQMPAQTVSAVPVTGTRAGGVAAGVAGAAAVGLAEEDIDEDTDNVKMAGEDMTKDTASRTAEVTDTSMDTAREMGEDVEGVSGDVASGAAGVAGMGMEAARRMDEDVEDVTKDVESGAAGVAGAGMEAAEKAGEEIEDVTGDVASGTAGVAGEGMDTARRMGEDISSEVTAPFTGNINPLDTREMSKYNYPLEYIEGVGPENAAKLKAIGIVNCLDLIKAGSTAKGRSEIVRKSGINHNFILEWVNHVDLYRIQGVGSEYADLLEATGVDTVVELAQRNPANLFEKFHSVNEEQHLVRKLPTLAQVEDWVAQAKGLPRIITY
jgi:uncharacterized membrane protein HdeD (DUF308 family)/predicted flap endonuclease-1-like 5' DNA nuclease